MNILILFLLILFNGVFAAAEIALVSVRKSRLQQRLDDGESGARIALELANDPDRFFSTVQVGITLIGVLAGAFGSATIARGIEGRFNGVEALAPYSDVLAIGLVVLVTTYLSLVVGELAPKRLAVQNPERITLLLARPMHALSILAAPIITLLSRSTDVVVRLLGVWPSDEPAVTDEDIRAMLRLGVRAGEFEESEHAMVTGVLSLDDIRVDSIMIPRTEITSLDLEAPAEEIRRRIVTDPHSLFPVTHGDLDNAIGFVHVKDVAGHLLAGETPPPLDWKTLVRPPLFVPESSPVSRVLELFKKTGQALALVIGEFGGVQGLVTINDIMEEIVGDVDLDPQAVQRDDGSWLLDGLLPISRLRQLFDLDLEAGYYRVQTLSGFVMTQMNRIPQTGERFDWGKLSFEVIDMDGNRIDKVLVIDNRPPDADEV